MTGDELKRLREKAGLTQVELSRLAEVDAITISRWERDAVPITALIARGLRDLFAELKEKKK